MKAQKNHKCLCYLAKMTFDKSHLGMCSVVPKGTLSPSKFLLKSSRGQGQRHGEQLPSSPLPLTPPLDDCKKGTFGIFSQNKFCYHIDKAFLFKPPKTVVPGRLYVLLQFFQRAISDVPIVVKFCGIVKNMFNFLNPGPQFWRSAFQ